ncbi:MAG: hypothetical protein OES34_12770, partial [Nitrosopumilus sp.]|nr:hypothetical protein [Nitrosopumilus sp.]
RLWGDSIKADNQRRASKWIRTVRATKIVVTRRVMSMAVARLRVKTRTSVDGCCQIKLRMWPTPKKHLSSSPPVGSGDPSLFCHTCVFVAGIHLVAVIPAVSGGYPFKENATWIPDKGRRE